MRIVIVSRSHPLEQMISYVVGNGVEIDIVGETDTITESGQIVAQEKPDWLFLLADSPQDMRDQLTEIRGAHTGLNIAAFAEGGKQVHISYGAQPGEDADTSREWETMSTSAFVAALTDEPAIREETPRLTDKEEHRA